VPGEVLLVASGDLRETANRLGWPAQAELERNVTDAFARHGAAIRRGPLRFPIALGPFDEEEVDDGPPVVVA
jgi:hypothetical protein